MYSISEIIGIITILLIDIYKGELKITNFKSPSEMEIISSFEIVDKSWAVLFKVSNLTLVLAFTSINLL